MAVFLLVFAAGAMFAVMPRPTTSPSLASVFSAVGVVSLPVVDARPAASDDPLLLKSAILQEVARTLSEPLADQARRVSGGELSQIARQSLAETDRAAAERSGVSSLYLDDERNKIQVAVTGADAEVVRLYANAVMRRYVDDRNAALGRARTQALSAISKAVTDLEPALTAVAQEVDRSAKMRTNGAHQTDDTGLSTSNSLSDIALSLSSVAAASRLLDSLSDAPVTYSEATVSAAPGGKARVTPVRVLLALALMVAALSAVVIALVVDSLSPPRAS